MFLLVIKWCFLTSGFLKSSDGKILKPIQCPTHGERERYFYVTVFDPACIDPVLLKMRPLLLLNMGVYQSPMAPDGRSIRTTQPLCMTWSCCMVIIEMVYLSVKPLPLSDAYKGILTSDLPVSEVWAHPPGTHSDQCFTYLSILSPSAEKRPSDLTFSQGISLHQIYQGISDQWFTSQCIHLCKKYAFRSEDYR